MRLPWKKTRVPIWGRNQLIFFELRRFLISHFSLKRAARFGGYAILLAFVAIFCREALRPIVLIDGFTAPRSIQEQGFVPIAISNSISDKIAEIQETVHDLAQMDTFLPTIDNDVPNIEVRGTNWSLRLIEAVQELAKRRPVHVEGEIVFPQPHSSSSRQVDTGTHPLEVQFHIIKDRRILTSDTFIVSSGDMNDAIVQLSRKILETLNPHVLALEAYQNHNEAEALRFIQICIHESSGRFSKWGYLVWSYLMIDDGRYDEAISKAQQAITLDKTFVLPYVSWGNSLEAVAQP